MQFKTAKNILLRSLSHIQGVVEKRNTLPILSNVKIETGEGFIRLTATDMDLTICENITAEIISSGEITIAAHTFYEVIKKLPDNSVIEISYNQDSPSNNLKIIAARNVTSLPVIPTTEFPLVESGNIVSSFSMPKEDLIRLIDRTKFAISTEEARYYLHGIFFHDTVSNGKDVIRSVATDGHRLARIEASLPEGAKKMPQIIVPKKTILEVKKILDENSDTNQVEISISESKIKFSYGNAVLISRLIDGSFPPYDRVIPTNNHFILKTKLKPFVTAIDRVSTIASDKDGKTIKFIISQNNLVLVSENNEVGHATEELEIEYSGSNLEVAFNARYLLELTNVLQGENIEIRFADNVSPALVQDLSDPASLFVIMPMRV